MHLPSGEVETLLDGLPIPQGVAYRDGLLFVALGEPGPEEDAPPEAEGDLQASSVIVVDHDGDVVETYDLLEYELENNPDGQEQFDADGEPFDALSNPFALQVPSDRILVADAGANALLAIDRESGEISTLFVPPVITPEEVEEVEECTDHQADPGVEGCDPVLTGVDVVDGEIYLSTLARRLPGPPGSSCSTRTARRSAGSRA